MNKLVKATKSDVTPSRPNIETAIDTQEINGNLKYLRSCRFQVQNPENCEVTSYYINRTDKNRFRLKIFRGGKCLLAQYINAETFAQVFLTTKF